MNETDYNGQLNSMYQGEVQEHQECIAHRSMQVILCALEQK